MSVRLGPNPGVQVIRKAVLSVLYAEVMAEDVYDLYQRGCALLSSGDFAAAAVLRRG